MPTRFRIDHRFKFDEVTYTSIKHRKMSNFSYAGFQDSKRRWDITLQWPDAVEIGLIADWFKQEQIYRPFGFSRSVPEKYVRRGVVPDLTGTMEAVEFLSIRDRAHEGGTPIGFLICYEAQKTGDANQEVDFAITHEDYRGRTASLVKVIKICLLSYLFAVRGAHSVCWVRRKRVQTAADPSGQAPGSVRYRQQGRRHVVTRERFVAMLRTLERTTAPEAMPVVVLEADRHSYLPSTQDDEGREDA